MTTSFIVPTLGKASAIFRSHGLTPFRNILSPDVFKRAFFRLATPKTILIPEVVFWLMVTVALGDGSMAGSIAAFWTSLRATLPRLPLKPVTEEAFCMARRALPLRFFLRLFADVVNRFVGRFDSRFRWKGRRLLGIDGTEVNLPRHPHLRRLFPGASNQHGARGCPQARLVGLVGLFNGLCYDFRLTGLGVGEQDSARRLLRFLKPSDLLLADRNFPDLATFAGVLARGADFLFHLPSNRFLGKTRIPTPVGRADQWYADLALPRDLQQKYPALGDSIRVRIIQYQWPGFQVSWLITSLLDTTEFPAEQLVDLYHQRWRQETFHREWKYTLKLSNLRSRSATGILKEVLVQLTLNNVFRWIMAEACNSDTRPVDLKLLETKRLILATIPAMTAAPVRQLLDIYQDLLLTIARECIVVRPGRSYPRTWDARGRPKGKGKIAAPAKLPTPKEIRRKPI